MRILLIEDETDLAKTLRRALIEEGLEVDMSADGEEGLYKAQNAPYDAVILDLMLPKLDGAALLERLRAGGSVTPVLILTARDALADKVSCLNLGADDYLTKPFALEELIARVRALIRRGAHHPTPVVKVRDIEIDTVSRSVRKAGQEVVLTAKEYALLEYLALHRGELVTRSAIYEHIYDEHEDTFSNVVDVYVANLRKKLGKDLLETRRGHGYILRDELS
jgi:two-component system, OmpR family, response regulator